jgi:menaquinol-cytochrome c reductase iron-sulfur subunit
MDPVSNPPPSDPAVNPALERRSFLTWVTYGLGAVAAAVTGIPFIGYVLGARKAPVKWLSLGRVSDFPQDQTRLVTFNNPIRQPWDGMVAHTGVFVRFEGRAEREADEAKAHTFLVLAVNCAHLGCPVEWFPESGLFMCPCHGGVYYANGERASGPPPRGLYRCVYRVKRADGALQLEVQAPHDPTLQDTLDQG